MSIDVTTRDNGIIRKLAAYVILGINNEGYKEVLTIEVGETESSKYSNEEKALEALERVTKKWDEKYPNSMKWTVIMLLPPSHRHRNGVGSQRAWGR